MGQPTNDPAVPSAPEVSTVLFVDPQTFSPGMLESPGQNCCWLGAEVQVENKIARRCSYEEMVHDEPQINSDTWYQAVLRVTQWAITLQDIVDEQRPKISKCLCHKASNIGQKLNHLLGLLCQTTGNEDEIDLIQMVDDVQSALRAGVSIQVRFFTEIQVERL